jgi:alanine dehydrogenase
MNIGIPKERRPFEYRIGLTPTCVKILTENNHTCNVEHNAGLGAGFSDLDFEQAGARIVYSPHEVFGRADLLVKVARPLQDEIEWLRPGTILTGMLHLISTRRTKIDTLLENKITAFGLEQLQLPDGTRPVLASMSQIGGLMSAQIAALHVQNNSGGKGVLLSGLPGVPPAEVVIVGAGVFGTCATQAFLGMGAHVTVLDSDLSALQRICDHHHGITTVISNSYTLTRACSYADILVGAVLIPGELAPVVIKRQMVRKMKPRALIIDASIDQGGCVETSRPTTHDQPTFVEENVIHYCVPNMPGVVARTSTYALTNASFPYILEIANKGVDDAINDTPVIKTALNTYQGEQVLLSRTNAQELED